jgi:hypothetical protein
MNTDLSLLELPDEQLAPFTAPRESDVRLARLEIERHKRKLNEASPAKPYGTNGWGEL